MREQEETIKALVEIQRAAERTFCLVQTIKFSADQVDLIGKDFPNLALEPEIAALLLDLRSAVGRASAIMDVLMARADLA